MTGGRLRAYDLRRVPSLAEALALLASEPGVWRPFAGGTDLMVQLEAGTLSHTRYLDLWPLDELRGIANSQDELVLGALTTYSDVLAHPLIQSEFPLLCRAAAETGGVATQNRGTIGGNIANASPAADTPPVLLVYDAVLELVSARGMRHVPYEKFHTGYKSMDLAADEIIARVRLSRGRHGWRENFRKVGTRRAQAIAKVCFAGAARVTGGIITEVRIAFGSLAPTVRRCAHVEAAVRSRRVSPTTVVDARAALIKDIAPIGDIRSTVRYRVQVAQNLLADFLERL